MKSGFTVWFTGLSGSGKSTIASALADALEARGHDVEVLDGDEFRKLLSRGLGYSRVDRDTNVARIAFVAALLAKHGASVIAAAISPYAQARREARQRIGNFLEVYLKCSLDELMRRDAKGLYVAALSGQLKHFTGISDPYEEPEHPDVALDTEHTTIKDCVERILCALEERGIIRVLASAREGHPQ